MLLASRTSSTQARLTLVDESSYTLSERFIHLVESAEEFGPVIDERMCRLQNTLANLNPKDRKQAICDIVFLKAIVEGKELDTAQELADSSWLEIV